MKRGFHRSGDTPLDPESSVFQVGGCGAGAAPAPVWAPPRRGAGLAMAGWVPGGAGGWVFALRNDASKRWGALFLWVETGVPS